MDNYPVEELYFWGHEIHKPLETMFIRFMRIAKYLKNQDAIFYLAFKSIMFRNYGEFGDFNATYEELDLLSSKHHSNSVLLKSMLDVYYFQEKRNTAIATLINMTKCSTKRQIPRMIKTFKMVTRAIYPDILFDQILAPPICNKFDTEEVKHYRPDGMPVYAREMDNFTCNNCKVAIIFACLL